MIFCNHKWHEAHSHVLTETRRTCHKCGRSEVMDWLDFPDAWRRTKDDDLASFWLAVLATIGAALFILAPGLVALIEGRL